MRILFLITRAEPVGGAQIYVRELARVFAAQHEVAIACGGDASWFNRHLGSAGVRTFSLTHLCWEIRPWADLRAVFELRKLIKEYQPDLLSLHSSKAGLVGRIAGKSLRVPVVFTAHGWAFTEGVSPAKRRLYRLAERIAAPMTDHVVAVSQYDRDLAVRQGVVSPEKITTVHNGVPDLQPGMRVDPAASPPRMVMVARFGQQKDHATLLRALSGLRNEEWTLSLVGDGETRSKMERLARELEIHDRIEWVGEVDDVSPYLARSQIAVLASLWEGFPLTIVEAMRAGLPVVASDVGGVREAVIVGQTGLLAPREDVDSFREQLRRLITDPQLRVKMGAAGRERYERYFTFERMAARTLEIYYDAVSSSRSSRVASARD